MNRMMRSSLVALMVLTAALFACKQGTEAAKEEAKPAKDAGSKPTGGTADKLTDEDKADIAMGEKLNRPIYCQNHVSRRAHQSKKRYGSWLGKDGWAKGPSGNEKNVYGLYEVLNVDTCKKKLAEARDLKTDLGEVDKAVVEYEKVLDALVPLVKKAHDYYDQKKYKDDKFVEGKSMHKPLADAFDAFSKADEVLSKAISTKNDELRKKTLSRLERLEGKKLSWHHLNMMSEAKTLSRASDFESWDKFDAAKYGAVIDVFEKAVTDTEEYAQKNTAEKSKRSGFDSMLSRSKEYLKATRDMMRRKRDKKAWSFSELSMIRNGNGWMVEGHVDKVFRTYNELIDASNSMN